MILLPRASVITNNDFAALDKYRRNDSDVQDITDYIQEEVDDEAVRISRDWLS